MAEVWNINGDYPFLPNVTLPKRVTSAEKRIWRLRQYADDYPELSIHSKLGYREAISTGVRGTWYAEVNLNNRTFYKGDIVSIQLTEAAFESGEIGVGNAASSYVAISLRYAGTIKRGDAVAFRVGLLPYGLTDESDIIWFSFQTFYVTDIDNQDAEQPLDLYEKSNKDVLDSEDADVYVLQDNDVVQTFTAYDAMYFLSNYDLDFSRYAVADDTVLYAKNIMAYITLETGINFDLTSDLETLDIVVGYKYGDLKSMTWRDVIAMLALTVGRNARIERDDALRFVTFRNRTELEIFASDQCYSIEKNNDAEVYAVCTGTGVENRTIWRSKGQGLNPIAPNDTSLYVDISGDAFDLLQGMTSAEARGTAVAGRVFENLTATGTYMPGEIQLIGDPSIQVGDIVTYVDMQGVLHRFPVMENILEYDGGVRTTITAYATNDCGTVEVLPWQKGE